MSEDTPTTATRRETDLPPETEAAGPAGDDTARSHLPGRLVVDDDRVAWLVLDDPDKRVNTLSTKLFEWLEGRLARLEDELPRGLVVLSGKPDGFVAGADIGELEGLGAKVEVLEMLERGHRITNRFAALPFPKVAAIHGACLGGGLELALACDRRVATEHPKTKLGFPEVQLGLIPGMGGTQRLPRLVAVPDALDLILTGKQVDAKKARRLGLVDETCAPEVLRQAAVRLLDEPASKLEKRRSSRRPLAKKAADLVAKSPLGDKLVYDKARRTVLAKSGGHYPAPLAAVDVVERGMGLPLPRALQVESGAFAELVVSDAAKNLMRIFFMKNDVEARAGKIAKGARELERIGVLGAGFMGSGIAQVLSYKGYSVVMKDKDTEGVGRGLAFAADRFDELVSRRRYTPRERELAMGRILGTVDYEPLAHVPFVVEAVFEDLDVKHRVIRELEEVAPEDLVFASNTSTLPIAEIATASRRPENVVGMHFFSPVHKMPLVEVIRHPGTSDEALATTVEVARRMGKTVIVVEDGPGFFTSRVLGPFLNEAAWMLTEGASVEEIDRAVKRWGFPVGPIALLDEVGLDVAHHAGEATRSRLGGHLAPPPVFERLIGDGRLGRKSKRGFYRYDGKAKEVDPEVYELLGWRPAPIPEGEIAERCWLQMLNETARTIEDGVIENPNDLDIGVIFGFGFPPFRGGILHEADRRGLPWVVERLSTYAERHGDRLAPADLLVDMAERDAKFHDAG